MKRITPILLIAILCLSLCASIQGEAILQEDSLEVNNTMSKYNSVSSEWKTVEDELRSGVYIGIGGGIVTEYTHASFQLHIISVEPYQVYKSSIYQSTGGTCYAVADAEGNVLSYERGTGTLTEFEITIPEQGATLYINRYAGGTNNIVVLDEKWKTVEDELRSGVYIGIGGGIVTEYTHASFQLHTISVEPYQVYKSSIYQSTGGTCYAVADAEGNVLSYERGTGTLTEFEITIPEQGATLYINRYAGGTNNIVMLDSNNDNNQNDGNNDNSGNDDNIQDDVTQAFTDLFPLTKATDHMTVTIIDDDTVNIGQVKRFYEKCEAAGIKGTFACITSNVKADPELKDLLLQYQNEGYQVTYHCHSQIAAYKSDTRDFDAAQADFVTGLREMRELGFINYDYWVNPYGVTDKETQSLAKKWGMKCMVTVKQDYETKESDNRFAITRISLYTAAVDGSNAPQQDPADPAWYQYNFEKLKTAVNNCAAENGWLIICTHMWDNTLWEDSDRLTEFVEYVKSVAPNAQFMTLGEAFTEREPIYRLHEMR